MERPNPEDPDVERIRWSANAPLMPAGLRITSTLLTYQFQPEFLPNIVP